MINKKHFINVIFLLPLFFAVILHVGLVSFLPYPADKANLVILAIVTILIMTESGKAIWLGFFTFFLVELFSTSPFGIALYSGTISTLLAFWAYKSILNNQTALSAISLTAAMILIYHFLFSILLFIYNFFSHESAIFNDLPFTAHFFELAVTSALSAVSFYFLKVFVPDLNASRLKK